MGPGPGDLEYTPSAEASGSRLMQLLAPGLWSAALGSPG